MQTLLLVDGSSYLYRAFYAMPDLRNAANEPTGAIFGVLKMLRRLHQEVPADYSACVFDAKGKTFRDDWYPEYKANRPSMPEEMAVQIEPLLEAIRAMGWPLLMETGVEADDVIGTLARQAEAAGLHSVISTGDKDLAQLVSPHIRLVNTMTEEHLDEAGVLAKFGVPPARIVDYLTLVGDTVDNVPGVAKVGAKTAVKWLQHYGDLDNLVVHAAEIGGVVGNNLRAALEWLPQARRLVTVKCDVQLPVKPQELAAQPVNYAKLDALFERFDFKNWRRELAAEMHQNPPDVVVPDAPAVTEYCTIQDQEHLLSWLEKLQQAKLIAIDTETTGLDPMQARIVGLSLCVEAGRAAYLPLHHTYPGVPDQLAEADVWAVLRPVLEDASRPKLGQNLKYDRHIFANHGIHLAGALHDTLLQSYVLESHKPHDMDNLAERHLRRTTTSYNEVTGKGASQIGFDQVGLDVATHYAAEDADITLQLHQTLWPQVQADAHLLTIYRDIEMPVTDVLFRMERTGVLLDTKLLETQSRELGLKMLELEQQAHVLAGQPFNLNSPKQIQEILFVQQKLPVGKKTAGGKLPSTDEDVLKKLALDYPLPKLLLEYRSLAKLKSTYTDKLPRMVHPVTGRVHTNYGQAVAVTGRLASNDPNLQNIPVRTAEGRRIREAFIAPAGHALVSADYSQIELRIMAHLSQDASLLRAFAAGEDIHRATAAEVFGVSVEAVSSLQRRYAKEINFGLMYGQSAFGLAETLGIERGAAKSYIESYFARYPGVKMFMDRTRSAARQNGYVETVLGRRLWLAEIHSSNRMRQQGAERAAINAPMQGTAADIIKLAMIAVQNWLDQQQMATKLTMQVHDELVLEVPLAELSALQAKLPRLMGDVLALDVPLEVQLGYGANWDAAH